jgi:uncharacterized protein YdaU (DUF1376 family)
MPLYADAYMADTMHLTEAEDGVYMRLLMCMWRMEGYLPNDDDRLARFARITKTKWVKKYRPVLEPFFDVSDDFWTQKRLKKEWETVSKRVSINREKGKRGGRPKSLENNETEKPAGSSGVNPNHNPDHKPEESKPYPYPYRDTNNSVPSSTALRTPSRPSAAPLDELDSDNLDIPWAINRSTKPVTLIAAFEAAREAADIQRRPHPKADDITFATRWSEAGITAAEVYGWFLDVQRRKQAAGEQPVDRLSYGASGIIEFHNRSKTDAGTHDHHGNKSQPRRSNAAGGGLVEATRQVLADIGGEV